jgi:hypothetical protein
VATDHLPYLIQGTYPPVNSKIDFSKRYKKGEFGNASPTWNTLQDFMRSGYDKGPVHLRNRIAGGPTWYDVPCDKVFEMWDYVLNLGVTSDQLYISAMAPTERTVLQGEVIQSNRGGLDFHYSTLAKTMRESLREKSHYVSGEIARRIIQSELCPRSYDWLQILLERYPFHVVEFSTYAVEWGTIPGFNTVFWEVRNY